MKLLIQKDTFFNPDYFPIDMRHIGKGFLWNKEIDKSYILIIGLITPIQMFAQQTGSKLL